MDKGFREDRTTLQEIRVQILEDEDGGRGEIQTAGRGTIPIVIVCRPKESQTEGRGMHPRLVQHSNSQCDP